MSEREWEQWTAPEQLEQLEAWARDGLPPVEIAEKVGITPRTLKKWRAASKEIDDALIRGGEASDEKVEGALFKRCTGYLMPVKKAVKLKRVTYDNGKKTAEEERLENSTDETYVPPSVAAQLFWLKTRRPHVWRENAHEKKEAAAGDFVLHITGGEDAGED